MRLKIGITLIVGFFFNCTAYGAECATKPKLAFGLSHVVALTKDCLVWEWGLNVNGVFGNSELENSSEPIRVTPLKQVVDIAASSDYSLALLRDGRVVIWGNFNSHNLTLNPLDNASPWYLRVVTGVSGAKALTASTNHFLVLHNNGNVSEVVFNKYDNPIFTLSLPKTVAVSTSGRGSLALDTTGNVWQWPSTSSREKDLRPKLVKNLPTIQSISAALWHSIALDVDGNVWAWGSNDRGQLGIPNVETLSTPSKVPSLKKNVSIDASYDRSVALGANGQVYGWGGRWHLGAAAIPTLREELKNIELAFTGGSSAGNQGTFGIDNKGQLFRWKGSVISGNGYANSSGTVSTITFKNGTQPFRLYNE